MNAKLIPVKSIYANKFRLGETSHGKGVFALIDFPAGAQLLTFGGETVRRDQLPKPYDSVVDHYLQIGIDLYLGPSGEFCDFVNHSCDPNAGCRIDERGVHLFAIKDICAADELTFDYSTTMAEDEWELACDCGAALCRGVVQDFCKLPPDLRSRYLELGIVPDYIAEKYHGR